MGAVNTDEHDSIIDLVLTRKRKGGDRRRLSEEIPLQHLFVLNFHALYFVRKQNSPNVLPGQGADSESTKPPKKG